MEVTVEHLGSVQFEISARSHSVISDQSVNDGGFDEGMTPPELLLASLGSCGGWWGGEYGGKNKVATEGTGVRGTWDKGKDPVARMTNFVIGLDAPVELNEAQRKGVEEAVEHCLVHNTLVHPPKIELKVAGAVGVAEKK